MLQQHPIALYFLICYIALLNQCHPCQTRKKSLPWAVYSVTMVVGDMDWVGLTLIWYVSTSCSLSQPFCQTPICLGRTYGRQWNKQNHSQPNPCPRPPLSPCRFVWSICVNPASRCSSVRALLIQAITCSFLHISITSFTSFLSKFSFSMIFPP